MIFYLFFCKTPSSFEHMAILGNSAKTRLWFSFPHRSAGRKGSVHLKALWIVRLCESWRERERVDNENLVKRANIGVHHQNQEPRAKWVIIDHQLDGYT